jgi:hypothetical protein
MSLKRTARGVSLAAICPSPALKVLKNAGGDAVTQADHE